MQMQMKEGPVGVQWTCQTNWHVSWQKSKTNWVMSSPDARCQPSCSVQLSPSHLSAQLVVLKQSHRPWRWWLLNWSSFAPPPPLTQSDSNPYSCKLKWQHEWDTNLSPNSCSSSVYGPSHLPSTRHSGTDFAFVFRISVYGFRIPDIYLCPYPSVRPFGLHNLAGR